MLECRCSNLSKTFFYASFSGILSNRPLNLISNSSIFAWRTSAFIVSFFHSLENFFQLFNLIFFSDYILFTTLVSRIAFSLCFGDSESSTLLTKTFHEIFVDCLLFLILRRSEVLSLCKSLVTASSFRCLWCCFMSLKTMLCIRL